MEGAVPRMPDSRSGRVPTKAQDIARFVSETWKRPVNKVQIVFASTKPAGTLYKCKAGESATLKAGLSSAPTLDSWPETIKALCLHCSGKIPSTPLPAVKYKDNRTGKYFVTGYFCRPCCSLGFLMEKPNAETPRQVAWTREVLHTYFGVQEPMHAAGPRAWLADYGGPLSKEQYYGEDAKRTRYVASHAAPLVSFAMVMECMQQDGAAVDPSLSFADHLGKTRDLKRPKERSFPYAQQEQSGRAPLLLQYLAFKHAPEVIESPLKAAAVAPHKKSSLKAAKEAAGVTAATAAATATAAAGEGETSKAPETKPSRKRVRMAVEEKEKEKPPTEKKTSKKARTAAALATPATPAVESAEPVRMND